MENMHHINMNEINRVYTQEMENHVVTSAEETHLLREAGIDPRGWLARRLSAGMVAVGESLVRLGEGMAVEPESSPCDDRLVTA
jgi:hypothetical protein